MPPGSFLVRPWAESPLAPPTGKRVNATSSRTHWAHFGQGCQALGLHLLRAFSEDGWGVVKSVSGICLQLLAQNFKTP